MDAVAVIVIGFAWRVLQRVSLELEEVEKGRCRGGISYSGCACLVRLIALSLDQAQRFSFSFSFKAGGCVRAMCFFLFQRTKY